MTTDRALKPASGAATRRKDRVRHPAGIRPDNADTGRSGRNRLPWRLLAASLVASGVSPVAAQVKMEQDGRWRATIGAGATQTSGNTNSRSTHVTAQTGMANESRSLAFHGSALYGRADGIVGTSRFTAGTNWTWELGERNFAFGNGDWLRDRFANLDRRTTVSTGLGRHLAKSLMLDWDVFGGVAYSHDEYITATEVNGLVRRDYGRPEALIGTETHYRPSDSTTLHQRLVILPAVDGSGSYRVIFEGGLSVAVTTRLAMTATVTWNRNSDPGAGLKRNDTLLVTGLTFKFD